MSALAVRPSWSTACPDWQERLLVGRPLIPFAPLFPKEAARGLDLFKTLTIVDATGRPTFASARPWILDFVGAIFGAYDAEAGEQLISEFFLLIAKKNGKSTLAAGIMVTALMLNWREFGEYYILAPTKEVADNSYFPARDMVLADPTIRSVLKPSAGRVIENRNDGSFLKVIAADSETVTGKKTIGLLVDELHIFGQRANAENIILEVSGGNASRAEGFAIFLSTHSEKAPAGVFAQKLDEHRKIRDGKLIEPSKLPILYEHPPKLLDNQRFRRREFWHVTIPNLDVSVRPAYLEAQMRAAERKGKSSLAIFFAKFFNVQANGSQLSDSWAGTEVWSRGLDRTLTLDSLLERCEVVTVGIDGGGLEDLLGVAVCGREHETGRWLIWVHGLVSMDGVERRKKNATDYLRFAQAEELTIFEFIRDADGVWQLDDGASTWSDGEDDTQPPPGDEEESSAIAALRALAIPATDDPNALPPDIAYIVDLVARIRDLGLLAQVGVDVAGIGPIVDALNSIGVTQDADMLDAVRQGIGLMGAIKTAERMLASRRLLYPQSALLDWCVGNLRIIPTATAMRVARDESGFGKIDPAMAVFNAIALMCMNPEAQRGSYLDHEPLLVL